MLDNMFTFGAGNGLLITLGMLAITFLVVIFKNIIDK